MPEEGEKHIDDVLLQKIKDSEREGGFSIFSSVPGTRINVYTQNSLYDITVIDSAKKEILIKGTGRYFNKPTRAFLSGSTYGGSVIKMGWIGLDMNMEVFAEGRSVTMSPTRRFEVYSPQNKLLLKVEPYTSSKD